MNNLEKPYVDFKNVFNNECIAQVQEEKILVTVGDIQGTLTPLGVTTRNCVVFQITENLIPTVHEKFIMIMNELYLIVGLGEHYTTKPLPLVFSNVTLNLEYNVAMRFSTTHLITELMEFRTIKLC